MKKSLKVLIKALLKALSSLPLIGVVLPFGTIGLQKTYAQTTYYWEPDATPNDGTLNGGAGAWNSTNVFFTTSSTDSGTAIAWPLSSTGTRNTVVFGGTTAGTVTLSALTSSTPEGGTSGSTDYWVHNLRFDTSGYTLTGGTVRFVNNGTTPGGITVNSGVTASINSNISAATSAGVAVGLTNGLLTDRWRVNGGGTLSLGGSNSGNAFIDGNTTVIKTGTGSIGGNGTMTLFNGTLRLDSTATRGLGNAAQSLSSDLWVGVTSSTLASPTVTVASVPQYLVVGSTLLGQTVTAISGNTITLAGNANAAITSTGGSATIFTPAPADVPAISTFDLNGRSVDNTVLLNGNSVTATLSTLSGNFNITNSTATGTATLALSVANAAAPSSPYTGVISNGTGKINLATTGTISQGPGFNASISYATQVLAGANTYTGFTSLGRGTINLDFNNSAAPASNILYNTGFGATPTGDDGKLIIDRPLVTILNSTNSAIGSLANLTITGKNNAASSQQFNGLKLTGGGAANILLNPTGTGTVTLNLGSTLERSAGSVINFGTGNSQTALSANATINAGFGTANTVLKDANGVAFAVIGGRDWAAKNAVNDSIVAATYTNSTTSGFAPGADITTLTSGGVANDTRLSANTAISTLRFGNSGGRSGINLGGNTLTTGGILTSRDVATDGNFITGGTITSPGASGSDIVIFSNAQVPFVVGAVLADGTAATGFTKGGSGTVFAIANNTYTGALTVQEGGLILTGTNTASGVNINGSQTNLTGAFLPVYATASTGSYVQLGNANALGSLGSGDINIGAAGLLAIKRSDNLTLNNNIKGAGGLTQGWSGTTRLVSAATAKYSYAGDTTVTAGTLQLDYTGSDSSILPNSSRVVLGGGTLESTSSVARSHNEVVRELALLSGASTITRTGSMTGVLQLAAITSQTIAGSTLNFTSDGIANTSQANTNGILGSNARFTVGGADWAVGAGNIGAYTAYTGLSLTGGTDTVNSLQALTGTTAFTGSRTTNTLKLTNSSASSQTLDIGTGNTLTLTAGGLLTTGADAVVINNGTLRSNTATNSDLIIHQYNTGGLTINSVISNGTGASTLTKSGNGNLVLGGTNTYTGPTFLNGGVTSISSNANLGAQAAGAAVNLNNATLKATANVILSNGSVGTNNRGIVLNGIGGTIDVDPTFTLTVGGAFSGSGGLTKIGAGTLDVRDVGSISAPIVVNAGTLRFGAATSPARADITVGSSGTVNINNFGVFVGSLSGSGTVTNTGPTNTNFSVGGLSNDTTFSGQLTGALNFQKLGGGTTTLTGANNNYTGTTIIGQGTLAVSGSGALPTATAVDIQGATGTLDISGLTASSLTIGSLTSIANSSVVLGSKNLIVGNSSSPIAAGNISGVGGSLTKNGAGTLTLSGANTFTGGVFVNNGTLATGATGTFGSGDVTVVDGARLTFGNNSSLFDTGTLFFDKDSASSIISLSFSGAETFFKIQDTVSSTFLDSGTYTADDLNNFFGTSVFTGAGSITLSAIPEPGASAAIAGLGILGFAALRRRRRA
jgi:fibronectin-binding autotransporter adhesin